MKKADIEFNQLAYEMVRECKSAAPGATFSLSVRNRLEKYKKTVRRKIVNSGWNNTTPLFVVCERGNAEMAEYLVKFCDADMEQRGLYQVKSDKSVHTVTPLWCAAVSAHLAVVKVLVELGADINAVSDSGSTPVRSACFMTHVDIVVYLVEKGADIHKPNHNGGTCLINSVQSEDLCVLLLKNGADVNASDIQMKTALHYAIQEFRYSTTKILLEHGADPYLKSRHGDDALQTACLKGATQIFECLVAHTLSPLNILADGCELMGSTFFDEHNDKEKAIKYWRRATALRTVLGKTVPKTPSMPKHECFRNAVEFTTLAELEAIALDVDDLRIQSLLMCERILGKYHKDTLYRLMYRGASYADARRFQPCIDLWRRALEIRVENDSLLHTDTCFTAQALVRIIVDLNGKRIEETNRNRSTEEHRFSDVVAVFKVLARYLVPTRPLLEMRPVHIQQQESFDEIFKCVTYMIHTMISMAETKEMRAEVRTVVQDLVRQNPRNSTDDTLLHKCVSSGNVIHSSYSNYDDVIRLFPNCETVKVLLDCGAPVNARNATKATPLYVASCKGNFSNELVSLLLQKGAHLDMPNESGDTPAQLLLSNSKCTINIANHVNLQCLAAQAVAKYDIETTDLPLTLRHFVECHRR